MIKAPIEEIIEAPPTAPIGIYSFFNNIYLLLENGFKFIKEKLHYFLLEKDT